jgi:hypothetical protein
MQSSGECVLGHLMKCGSCPESIEILVKAGANINFKSPAQRVIIFVVFLQNNIILSVLQFVLIII